MSVGWHVHTATYSDKVVRFKHFHVGPGPAQADCARRPMFRYLGREKR